MLVFDAILYPTSSAISVERIRTLRYPKMSVAKVAFVLSFGVHTQMRTFFYANAHNNSISGGRAIRSWWSIRTR